MEKLKRVVAKEELIALTGDFVEAVLLNEFIRWTNRIYEFNEFIDREKNRADKEGVKINIRYANGWISKTVRDISKESLLNLSTQTVRMHLRNLVEDGWLVERESVLDPFDKTKEYKVNLDRIEKCLNKLGYKLDLNEEDII